MPRHSRILSCTRTYHIVIKGADRVLLFETDKDYIKYLDILEYYKQECQFEIFAYCLMSNHVHLLIRHSENIALQTIFRRINTAYAVWFNMKYNRTGFLQNDRFFSEPVEDTDYLLTVAKYIHSNPLKAGIESSIGNSYPWSSYHDYFTSNSRLVDSQLILSILGGVAQFKDYHYIPEKESDKPCLDIERMRHRIPDDVAKCVIQEISHCSTSTEFQNLSICERNQYIAKIYESGISIRQLNRLTGIPKGVISRIIGCS